MRVSGPRPRSKVLRPVRCRSTERSVAQGLNDLSLAFTVGPAAPAYAPVPHSRDGASSGTRVVGSHVAVVGVRRRRQAGRVVTHALQLVELVGRRRRQVADDRRVELVRVVVKGAAGRVDLRTGSTVS